jgi:hypothetical protein
MAGVKGRSGRKSTTDEQKRLAIIDKAWETVKEFLENPDIPLKSRVSVAEKLVVKNIPNDVNGMDIKQVVMMGEITKGGEPLKFNIGDKLDEDRSPEAPRNT